MPLYQVVVLAIVQGITEFLPISSTAHLVLVPWFFGWRDPGLTFDIALHLGTLVAVAAYFARTWVRVLFLAFGRRVLPAVPGDPDEDLYANPRLFWYLVAATIPAGLAGLALERHVETTLRGPVVIAVMLIGIGLVLWWADRAGRMEKDLDRMTLSDALAVGVAQALAIIPGTSRSGVTMAAALFRGVSRASAARFSFLLSTPIIGGAALKAAWNLFRAGGVPPEMRPAFAVGILVSAVTGYLAIALFIRFLQTGTFQVFIWYRIALGVAILVLVLAQALELSPSHAAQSSTRSPSTSVNSRMLLVTSVKSQAQRMRGDQKVVRANRRALSRPRHIERLRGDQRTQLFRSSPGSISGCWLLYAP